MVGKEEARQEILKLIERYNKYKDSKEFSRNEKQVRQSLIDPFIQKVLSYDVSDPEEVKVEIRQNGKVADYIIYLDGISQFVIEAKSLDADIRDEKFYLQAINYALSKEKRYAVLTNFRYFVILRADARVELPQQAQIKFIDIKNNLESDFEFLWCFSKEKWSLEKGKSSLIYNADLKERDSLDLELLESMQKWRQLLLTNLRKYPRKNNFSFEEDLMYIEEEIQRFIDRLVFICFCEDKELREPELKSYILDKTQRFRNREDFLIEKIKKLFLNFWDVYDSDLFNEKGYCDKFFFDDETLLKLLLDLKKPKGRLPWDFSSISVEILGRVYEEFLGHLIHGTKKFREEKSRGKRKQQGIYYTPKYIVEYIINNTLREYIKDKTFEEINKVKILDPACGSGSFLIKVYDILIEESQKKLNRELTYEEKKQLVLNCIHGVDLDERAVDIAKLSISLKVAEKDKRLPTLHNNIKNGNSLIDDETITKKAFKWREEFKDIMNEGGFDIVIGNPPYGAEFNDKELTFLKRFKTSSIKNYDSYIFFIENSASLLKEDGRFSFIVPDTFLRKSELLILRELILNNFKIKSVAEIGAIFSDAKVTENIIFVFEKSSNQKECENNKFVHLLLNKERSRQERLDFIKRNNWDSKGEISQKSWLKSPEMRLGKFNKIELLKIINKIEKGIALKDLADIEISRGSEGGKDLIVNKKLNSKYKPVVIPEDIDRYKIKFNNRFYVIDKNRKYEKEKLLIIRIRNTKIKERIIATYDNLGFYTLKTIQIISLKENSKYNLKHILAILNSKLMNFYCHHFLSDDINKNYIQGLKIKFFNTNEDDKLIKLTEKIISLNVQLQEIGDKNTNQKIKIEEGIKKLDNEIDELVYKIYNITEEEKKVIEESLK